MLVFGEVFVKDKGGGAYWGEGGWWVYGFYKVTCVGMGNFSALLVGMGGGGFRGIFMFFRL